ncbi:MAG: DNA adenine methylase [Hydrococcus sp. RM1_1_31]|nr:DNA adenine methylase [Hydrococcus sp. RM1_1_31]
MSFDDLPPLYLLPFPIKRPAARWYGGKWLLGRWIASYFSEHKTYAEPFGGMWSVGLQKLPSSVEVYNDLNPRACNFWRQLRDHSEKLIPTIEQTTFKKSLFAQSLIPSTDLLEDALRFYAHCLLSYPGGGVGNCGTSTTRLLRPECHDHRHLWAIASRIKHLEIYNQEAFEIIQHFDRPDTLFYVDPCYLPQTKNSHTSYLYEMTEAQHIELAQSLNSISGMAIVSGYPSELYSELYSNWLLVEREIHTTGKKKGLECLWIKPNQSQRSHYMSNNSNYIVKKSAPPMTFEPNRKQFNQLSLF